MSIQFIAESFTDHVLSARLRATLQHPEAYPLRSSCSECTLGQRQAEMAPQRSVQRRVRCSCYVLLLCTEETNRDKESVLFDAIMIATGHHVHPRIPTITGQERFKVFSSIDDINSTILRAVNYTPATIAPQTPSAVKELSLSALATPPWIVRQILAEHVRLIDRKSVTHASLFYSGIYVHASRCLDKASALSQWHTLRYC